MIGGLKDTLVLYSLKWLLGRYTSANLKPKTSSLVAEAGRRDRGKGGATVATNSNTTSTTTNTATTSPTTQPKQDKIK